MMGIASLHPSELSTVIARNSCDEAIQLSFRRVKVGLLRFARNDVVRLSAPYTFSTPHHSAMNNAVALVDFRSESRSTYSLKPCIAAPLAPKHRLGML